MLSELPYFFSKIFAHYIADLKHALTMTLTIDIFWHVFIATLSFIVQKWREFWVIRAYYIPISSHRNIGPFIINYSFIIKMTTKSRTRDVVLIWLFSEFLFHLFSFACWRINFLLSIFFFWLQSWYFFQWWQIIKRNAVLFTKKSRCARVMMNEWLIMSVLVLFWKYNSLI